MLPAIGGADGHPRWLLFREKLLKLYAGLALDLVDELLKARVLDILVIEGLSGDLPVQDGPCDAVGQAVVCGLPAGGFVFMGVKQDITGPGNGGYPHLINLLGLDVVLDNRLQSGCDVGVREGFGGESLQGTFHDLEGVTQAVHQSGDIPVGAVNLHEPLFTLKDLLRAGVVFFSHEGGKDPRLHRQGVHRVFHHGKLPGGGAADGVAVAAGDTDGVDQLVFGQAYQFSGHYRRDELGDGSVMPLAFPEAWHGELAQALLELVGQHDSRDDIFHGGPYQLTHVQGGGDEVRRVGRVLFPVDVVEVQGPDGQGVDEGGVNSRQALSAHQQAGLTGPFHLAVDFAHDLHVPGVESAEGAADGIIQVPLDLVNHIGGQVFIL
ncbi:hypothetical protein ES703_23228 [subsurface metagenome]